MQGHTDCATINLRRPLTDNMRRVLNRLITGGALRHADAGQADANCCRALCDRGYASWHIDDRCYRVTPAGIDAAKGDA